MQRCGMANELSAFINIFKIALLQLNLDHETFYNVSILTKENIPSKVKYCAHTSLKFLERIILGAAASLSISS